MVDKILSEANRKPRSPNFEQWLQASQKVSGAEPGQRYLTALSLYEEMFGKSQAELGLSDLSVETLQNFFERQGGDLRKQLADARKRETGLKEQPASNEILAGLNFIHLVLGEEPEQSLG